MLTSLFSNFRSLALGDASTEEVVEEVKEEEQEEEEGEIVCEAKGSIFLVTDDGSRKEKCKGIICAIIKYEDFNYEMTIKSAGGSALMGQAIGSHLAMTFRPTQKEFQWISYHKETMKTWIVKTDDDKQFSDFVMSYAMAEWETNHKTPYGKTIKKDEDKEYLGNTYIDEIDSKYDGSEDEGSDLEFDPEPERMEMTEEAWDYTQRGKSEVRTTRLGNLNVGTALQNRSFVSRDNKIGVMDPSNNNKVLNVIENVSTLDGDSFAPDMTMLHNRDEQMIMLHPNDEEKDRVQVMNLELGKVVEEWSAEGGGKIRSMAPAFKYGQRSGESTFVGVSKNSIFTMDPRVNTANKAQHVKMYSKAPNFTCMATNAAGHVAVGTSKGEISLYSETSKQAKTKLPGLGDGIVGMDVTEDGRWVLATTLRYLMLVDTQVEGRAQSGFQKSMPAGERPLPIKLQLRAKDLVSHQIRAVSLTPAHFNIGEGKERFIVSSTGPYIIMWDLIKVLKGNPYAYTIRNTHQDVAENPLFRFNHPEDIVVNTGDSVYNERVISRLRR